MLRARILADLVVVLDALFVAFVVLGMAAILIGIALRRDWARVFWFRVLPLLTNGDAHWSVRSGHAVRRA